MTEAKQLSGDRYFYAIAISRWDNEGGAIEDRPTHAAVAFTSATAAAAAKFAAHTVERERP
jgi:hypothetical protein